MLSFLKTAKQDADAVLMASGFSKRFGRADKLLTLFRGKPLARHTLELVCGLGCFHEILFVTASPAVRELAEGLPVRVLWNEHPELGQNESIRLGVAASGADYYGFFPCDQPLLDKDTVCRLLAVCRPGWIVQPGFQGNPGSPAFFSRAFREELLGLLPGEPGRAVIGRHPDSVITLAVDRPELLLDIDTPEALASLVQNAD